MAQMVGSAVVTEAVSTLFSFVSGKPGERESAEYRAEMLEMAVLKIRTVLDVSENWQITHPPLLSWKGKLKRVADEGDDILHTYKKQILESGQKQDADSTMNNSFRRCIARAAKRFLPFGRGDGELSGAMVRRFERLAAGAGDFFRFVESGGRPKRALMVFNALTRAVMAGDIVECSIRRATGRALTMILPWSLEHSPDGHGRQTCLWISYEDDTMWERNMKVVMVFRLSEAVDVVGITRSCIELLPPQFGNASGAVEELVYDMAVQGSARGGYSSPSALAVWCRRKVWKYHRSDCSDYKPDRYDAYGANRFHLPEPVVRFTALCYVSPLNDSMPLLLECHISPHLMPEKRSNGRHELVVEPRVLGELLLEVTDGRYEAVGLSERKRQWWCPASSTYLSMAPLSTTPLTISQWYRMENPERPRARKCNQCRNTARRRRLGTTEE